MNLNDKTLISLAILSLCSSLVGLFFSKNSDFSTGVKTMIGGFFFGVVVGFIAHDSNIAIWIKRTIVLLTSMFGKQIYDKVSNRIGYWLEKYIGIKLFKEPKIKTENENENETVTN